MKKKDKAAKSSSSSSSSPSSEEASADDSDPFDFTALQQGIDKSLDKLKNDLSKLRTGGRFNPEVLEALRVKLSKDSKENFRLGDLAQVLPKGGRSIQLLVGEKDVGFFFCAINSFDFEGTEVNGTSCSTLKP